MQYYDSNHCQKCVEDESLTVLKQTGKRVLETRWHQSNNNVILFNSLCSLNMSYVADRAVGDLFVCSLNSINI